MELNDKNGIVIYQDDNGVTKINIRFADEENISMHISNIFKDNELDENRTYKKVLLVRPKDLLQLKRSIAPKQSYLLTE